MKLYLLPLLACCVATANFSAQTASPRPSPARTSPATDLSPANQLLAAAEQAVKKQPGHVEPYNALAFAYARRARETADTEDYAKAENALQESFRIQADNFDGKRIEAWVLLGRHEFAKALEAAETLRKINPDDLLVHGLLADAHVELGNYKEAEEAAQFMLDLRPGSVPGLTRGAYLRELFGDTEGAIEFMTQAFQRTPGSEVEDRAWILTHVAHLHLSAGQPEPAETLLNQALDLFPDYHYALAQSAKVHAAQKNYAKAAHLLRRHVAAAPHPENFFYLAEALRRAGLVDEAEAAFAEFERKARAEMDGNDNANRELVRYYIDHAGNPAEALRIARREIERRRDVHTLHAFARALHADGQHQQARRQIESALAVGVRDAEMLYHAGVIAEKLGDRPAAADYLKESLEANPRSAVADAARKLLPSLATPPADARPEIQPQRIDSKGQ